MKQGSLLAGISIKRTRKREFLDAMDRVVPWAELVCLIEPYAPERGRRGQRPFGVEVLLRIHFLQQWFNLSDPAMEEALHDVPMFRDFVGLTNWSEALPSDSSILRFRRRLERATTCCMGRKKSPSGMQATGVWASARMPSQASPGGWRWATATPPSMSRCGRRMTTW